MAEEALLVVYCTCPDGNAAAAVADALVEARLAACVSVSDVQSVYTWRGDTCREGERLLMIKTRRACFDRLVEAIRRVHPHEVPEIIGVPILMADRAYAAWIEESTN